MKLRAIVADDELQARKRVVRLLEALNVDVVAACTNADEVLDHYERVKPDLLVLDISMPGMSGLDLHAKLPDATVIFVTAHAEHAVDAYELGAVDYVMKPVGARRLAKALARIDPLRRTRAEAALPGTRLPIETRAGVVLVNPTAIIYAQFDGALVTIHGDGTSWLTTMTLKDLEGELPAQFARVDRRHILNLDEIARLQPEADGGYLAHTRTGATVPISRQAARDLRRRLGL